MRQVLLYVPLQLMGTLLAWALGPRARAHLLSALGFPLGLAAYVTVLVLLAAARVPYGVTTAAATYGGLLAVSLAVVHRRGWPDGKEWLVVLGWTAAFAAVAVAVSAVDIAVLTPDSHAIIAYGRVFVDDHGMARGLGQRLASQGAFQIVAQAQAALVRMDYLYALSPVLGLSFLAAFAVTLARGVRALGHGMRARVVIAATATAALASTPFFQVHLLYIHENLGSAVYVCLFVVLAWLAEVEPEPGYLPLAFLSLTAFCLQRVENPIAAALFLCLALLAGTRLPPRAVLPSFLSFSAIVAAWYVALARAVPAQGQAKLSPLRAAITGGAVVAVFAVWLVVRYRLERRPVMARLERRLPAALAAVAILALAGAFALRGENVAASSEALALNLGALEVWGVTWYGLAVLAAVGLFVEPVPGARAMGYGVGLYLVLVLLFSAAHGAYVVKPFDSGNRMALHVLPLAFYAGALKLAVMARRPRSAGGRALPT